MNKIKLVQPYIGNKKIHKLISKINAEVTYVGNEKILRVISKVNNANLNLKINSPEKFQYLLSNINKFMTQRLEDFGGEESIKWFLKSMKKYQVLNYIMGSYAQNSAIYKEQIIKNLNKYSHKTILNIVNEALEKKYIVYESNGLIKNNKNKLLEPSEQLLSAYMIWNIRHIANYSNAIKNIEK
tara:strand:- start:7633 stop:8184 length:552 start_codon:yes stop_codon:yes gene_type:complete